MKIKEIIKIIIHNLLILAILLMPLLAFNLEYNKTHTYKITSKDEVEEEQIDIDKVNEENKIEEHEKEIITKEERFEKQQKSNKKATKKQQKGTSIGKYKITHYGWDCCKSGVTATGYNVKNTIYYNDKTFGKVRIVAMSSSMPLYSIIKIKNYKFGGDIIAIVIDRGVGNGVIDLLVQNEKTASQYGIQKNVSIEILRRGK